MAREAERGVANGRFHARMGEAVGLRLAVLGEIGSQPPRRYKAVAGERERLLDGPRTRTP